MDNEFLMNDSYTISQVAMMTGLTDRTIRNYLSLGFLEGEKPDGQWRFTAEQLGSFMRHPSVKPSISAKKNGRIYDFLADTRNHDNDVCLVLDVSKERRTEVMVFFCKEISNGNYQNIHFSFEEVDPIGRVILRGSFPDVLRLCNTYDTLFK